ncbi:AraC family transcriptional regulator [Paenibacillus montanisoli]|uniref:AraC family transcriptional regulator n=2 Tax=Paenibacillus montanisoli TaxID=2081970 RepID=A0A328U637_9BACL|nr:AraC family transcriptional regulator [Paenibacillus montanisoli]
MEYIPHVPEEMAIKQQLYHFPPYITLAHMFSAPKGWEIKPRALNQYQLQYVVSGIVNYHIEGKDYVTRRGDLLLHRPHERTYVQMVDDEPYVCISIVFHFGTNPFPFESMFNGSHLLGTYLDHKIDKMLLQIVNNYRLPLQSDQMLCQGLLLQILSYLSEDTGNRTNQTMVEKTKAKLILIRNYIANHYQENIQHQDLELISGLSRNYITVKFKQAFGMTPIEFLIWTRIEKAKELAIHSNLSIGEIANHVGYADVHTFGKMFKKKVGSSLSQFCSALVTVN